jgi:hypothetical protein
MPRMPSREKCSESLPSGTAHSLTCHTGRCTEEWLYYILRFRTTEDTNEEIYPFVPGLSFETLRQGRENILDAFTHQYRIMASSGLRKTINA